MSVIVLGMEMPENCHVCGLCFGGLCYAIPPEVDEMCPDEDRPDWCPLRPLPAKHGRLIDADDATRGSLERTGKRLLAIDTATTIVEAEGE